MNSTPPDFCQTCGSVKEFWDGCYNCLATASDDIPMTTGLRRVAALNYRCELYDDYCDTHGLSVFRTQNGRCMKCTGRNGLEIVRVNSPVRSAARRLGKRTFPSYCMEHGITDHLTATGLCDKCYNASGSPRPADITRKPHNKLRRQARLAGIRFYQDTCPKHGYIEFHTHRGLCSHCYNSMGGLRPPSKWD